MKCGEATIGRIDIEARGVGQRLQGGKVAPRSGVPDGACEEGVCVLHRFPFLHGVISHVDGPEKDIAQKDGKPHQVDTGLWWDERQHCVVSLATSTFPTRLDVVVQYSKMNSFGSGSRSDDSAKFV